EEDRRAGRAEQAHCGRGADRPQPPTGPEEQAEAAKSPEEQRRDPNEAERLERCREERVAGVLLADPSSTGESHPLPPLQAGGAAAGTADEAPSGGGIGAGAAGTRAVGAGGRTAGPSGTGR